METTPKIEVCEYCSGVDVNALKAQYKIKVGCIGKCARKNPALNGKVYGFLNGEFVVCDTQAQFAARLETLGAYVPTGNKNPLVDAFLSTAENWRAEFDALRDIALSCGLTEELKWGQPCYTNDSGANIVILGAFKQYIAPSFFKGALLKDEKGLLVQQTENVQAGRQLRFKSVAEIVGARDTIAAYILEAIEIEKAGLEVPKAPKKEMELPAELESEFERNPTLLEAFYKLTPGRQRGYLFYFCSAKQAATRAARIEKYAPKIMNGLGIDD